MNTLKVVFFTFLICVIQVVLSIPPHYPKEKVEKEYAKLKDELIDTPQEKRDERLQEKVVLSRLEKDEELSAKDKEFGKLQSEKVFHEQISSLTLVRDILEQFKKDYLDKMRGYELKDADSIEQAYVDFFDPEFPKRDNIREMSNELYYFITDRNQSVASYIKNQRPAYKRASKFIHTYREYCIDNLNATECTLLIRMAPKIDSDVKNVVNYLAEKHRQLSQKKKSALLEADRSDYY